ncbi:uncharacterized protein PHALS_15342 [Plasmopara halstedii]|uniref:Uncharacterized protein n=1 Tax=Plasmopara halstedii TaxID=4781 RepID=A0A0P1AD85_PLAHL|nr:uncharacterized protein PHALS_15342 [Plasmopara halstedii]CEG38869.1 hypothetical protein PHALS_15342 [Plasmopara halstedii]|eukprot:XP_024575238.1 hypothetical protein PHALS_15342 [Plasmopara halstedii]
MLSALLLSRMRHFIQTEELPKYLKKRGMELVNEIVGNRLARKYFAPYINGELNSENFQKTMLEKHPFLAKETREKAEKLLDRASRFLGSYLKQHFYANAGD